MYNIFTFEELLGAKWVIFHPFKNLFAAIAAGRTDYENMLPMTLGVCKAA